MTFPAVPTEALKGEPVAADGNLMRRATDPISSPRGPAPPRIIAIVALASILVLTGRSGAPAAADADDEAAFVEAINVIRVDAGLDPLEVHDELTLLARDHAATMADAGEIFHADPISAGLTAEWQKIGENVGVGADVAVLVDAFVASPGHYANIIDPSFTHIGVGVIWHDNALYTTHRFLQPPLDDPEPPPAPSTTSAPASIPPAQPDGYEDPAPVARAASGVSPQRVEALFALLDHFGS